MTVEHFETIPGFGTNFTKNNAISGSQYADAIVSAIETGYRHIDTAQVYDSEPYLGRAIQRADVPRDKLILATKIHSNNLSYNDVLKTAEERLDCLGVEYIDILYIHFPAPPYDAEETLRAFRKLQTEGVISHIGLSNFTIELLEEAQEHVSVFAHQTELHPFHYDEEMVQYCEREDITLVAHTPLAQGEIVDDQTLVKIGEELDATPAQVTIAWLLSKNGVTAIPSGSGHHIEENFFAQAIEITEANAKRIESINRETRYIDYDIAPWNQ